MYKGLFERMMIAGCFDKISWDILVGGFSRGQYIIGIYKKDKRWYVYITGERNNLYLDEEFLSEDEAYKFFIEILVDEKERSNQ